MKNLKIIRDNKFIRRVGDLLIKAILNNVEEGIDKDDKPFKPYCTKRLLIPYSKIRMVDRWAVSDNMLTWGVGKRGRRIRMVLFRNGYRGYRGFMRLNPDVVN